MSGCCSNAAVTQSTGKFFSKRSKWYARSFRKGKLEKIQQFVIDELKKKPLNGALLLDIGSGVGKLHLTLLKNGAESATAIDMSAEMINHAKQFARTYGLEDKVTYHQGDFLELADSIPPADITMLDKVICCYENLEELISASARKTNRLYVLIFPANNLLTKILFRLQIFISKLFRSGFRPYWHNWDAVPKMLSDEGFTAVTSTSFFLWQAAVFQKG